MAQKNRGRSPKQKVRDAERRREALILRRRGLTYDQIAEKMGLAFRGAAHSLVTKALEELWVEPAEHVLKLELARLDRMFVGLTRAQKGGGEDGPELGGAYDGNPKAIIAAIKILDRRAKYLGLNAPEKTELSGPNGGPIVTADAKEALLAQLNSLADRLAAAGGQKPGDSEPQPGGSGDAPS